MSPLSRCRYLPASERSDLLPAACRLVWVWVLLGIFGLNRSRWQLSARNVSATADQAVVALWSRRATAIRRVGARLPGAQCLARALCLCWWMRSRGVTAELRMGIRRDEQGRVSGHAWVEYAGTPVDETAEVVAQFQPLRWRDNQAAGLIKR